MCQQNNPEDVVDVLCMNDKKIQDHFSYTCRELCFTIFLRFVTKYIRSLCHTCISFWKAFQVLQLLHFYYTHFLSPYLLSCSRTFIPSYVHICTTFNDAGRFNDLNLSNLAVPGRDCHNIMRVTNVATLMKPWMHFRAHCTSVSHCLGIQADCTLVPVFRSGGTWKSPMRTRWTFKGRAVIASWSIVYFSHRLSVANN